jgi:hypothetical protein
MSAMEEIKILKARVDDLEAIIKAMQKSLNLKVTEAVKAATESADRERNMQLVTISSKVTKDVIAVVNNEIMPKINNTMRYLRTQNDSHAEEMTKIFQQKTMDDDSPQPKSKIGGLITNGQSYGVPEYKGPAPNSKSVKGLYAFHEDD